MYQFSLLALLKLSGAAMLITTLAALLVLTLKTRAASRRGLALTHELRQQLQTLSQQLDQTSARAAEQAGRIAWLETRLRASARADDLRPAADETLISGPAASGKPSITERRHRILKLAQRGMAIKEIAALLGVPDGEVELIIELNHATLRGAA
jgi:DNA-binding NarL/FixJ family response regulator